MLKKKKQLRKKLLIKIIKKKKKDDINADNININEEKSKKERL